MALCFKYPASLDQEIKQVHKTSLSSDEKISLEDWD